MIDKIEVSRDEVLHYPWIDHTWVYVHYQKNSITSNPYFTQLLKILFKKGIEVATGESFEGIVMNDGYVLVQYATDEIIDILKKASRWILKSNLYAKDPESPRGKFFTENKAAFDGVFEEMEQILESKGYRYYFQCVDGMN